MNYSVAARFRPFETYIQKRGSADVVLSLDIDAFFKEKGVDPKLGVRLKREAERLGFIRMDPEKELGVTEWRVNGLRCRGVYVHASVPVERRVEAVFEAMVARSQQESDN